MKGGDCMGGILIKVEFGYGCGWVVFDVVRFIVWIDVQLG